MGSERDHALDHALLRLRLERPRHLGALHVDCLPGLDSLLRKELLRRFVRRHLAGDLQLQDRVLLRARRSHRLRRVLVLPSRGQLPLELQLRLIEGVALEETLAGILAEGDSVDQLQVLLALHLHPFGGTLQLRLQPLLRRCQPVARIGMRLQPFWGLPPAGLFRHAVEHLEERDHLRWVVTDPGHVPEPKLVRLGLVFA